MKTQLYASLTAAAATAFVCAPAQAFRFGTEGIQFDWDTKVEFTFNESHGSFQSTLNIFQVSPDNRLIWAQELFAETRASDNGSDNGWGGTCGVEKAVQGICTQSFIFLKDLTYVLGLDSGINGKVYSTSALNTEANGTRWISGSNPAGIQQAVFGSFGSIAREGTRFNHPLDFQSDDPFANLVKISFDDRGGMNVWGIPDLDFQDFSVMAKANAVSSVPEPTTLAGLGLVTCAIAACRRRTRREIS